MVRYSEIQQFSDSLGPFPGNFLTICPRLKKFRNFGRMESAQGHPESSARPKYEIGR